MLYAVELGTVIEDTDGPLVSKACTYLFPETPVSVSARTAKSFKAESFAPPEVLIESSTFPSLLLSGVTTTL